MSNLTIFSQPTNVVSNVKRELSEFAKASASTGLTNRRIQTNTNGTFKRIVNGEQIGTAMRGEINVIVVAWLPSVSRTFYKEAFDPNSKPTLPDCWSNLGVTPEEKVPNPQASSCIACPQNVKGSGNNANSKACRFQRRIAVLVEGDTTGELYQFNVPAKSLFGKGSGNVHPFESYVKFINANGEPLDNVVTKISFDPDADTLELLFTPVRTISDEEYLMVRAAQQHPDAKRYIAMTVAQTDKVTALPPAAAPVEAPVKAKVIRSEEPDDEDEVVAAPAEPVKRTKKPEAPVEGKPDLSSVIDQWGTD